MASEMQLGILYLEVGANWLRGFFFGQPIGEHTHPYRVKNKTSANPTLLLRWNMPLDSSHCGLHYVIWKETCKKKVTQRHEHI